MIYSQLQNNERYDKFMEAFDHIRNQIDKIYKELTRSENFKQGGSAYLTLEDSEVCAFFAYTESRNPTLMVLNITRCPL
jgi:chromosome segregation ATPase